MLGKKKPQMKPELVGQTELSAALWRKGLALMVSFSLLMVLIVAGTVAWYTRITNVTGITMDVAKFDFKADYVGEDFIINVTDYMKVKDGKAAPGTGGMIPILVGEKPPEEYAEEYQNEVYVDYSLNLDVSTMAPDFRRRIRYFYYTTDKSGKIQEVTIQKGSQEIKGTLAPGTYCYEYIYWEWVYTLDKACYYDERSNPKQPKWIKGDSEEFGPGDVYEPQDVYDFDAFDTRLGLGDFDKAFTDSDGKTWTADAGAVEQTPVKNGKPGKTDVDRLLLAYQKAMEVKLNISGAQARPEKGENAGSVTEGLVPGMTVMKPAEAGSNGGTGGGETGN